MHLFHTLTDDIKAPEKLDPSHRECGLLGFVHVSHVQVLSVPEFTLFTGLVGFIIFRWKVCWNPGGAIKR